MSTDNIPTYKPGYYFCPRCAKGPVNTTWDNPNACCAECGQTCEWRLSPDPRQLREVPTSGRLNSIIKRVTARLEYIEGRDGPNADVSVALSDLVAIRDAAIANTRAPDPVREELVALLNEAPCTCYNPDGSYPHNEDNKMCYRTQVEAAIQRTTP